jgi:hypothetical protein
LLMYIEDIGTITSGCRASTTWIISCGDLTKDLGKFLKYVRTSVGV